MSYQVVDVNPFADDSAAARMMQRKAEPSAQLETSYEAIEEALRRSFANGPMGPVSEVRIADNLIGRALDGLWTAAGLL